MENCRTAKVIGKAAAAGAALTAGLAAVNAVIARNRKPLEAAVAGRHNVYDWDGCRIFYTEAGAGRPVVLLHSHNAAASSFEMRRAFAEFETDHRVLAPDLPGYGLSERRARPYSAQTYIRFLHDFLEDVVREPAVVIASSVTAAQALAAAAEDAGLISHLVLITPTGLSEKTLQPPRAARAMGDFLGIPVWGQALFNAITSHAGIRRFEETRLYDNPWNVTHAVVNQAWRTSHQPGAIHAPTAFLTGALWLDARADYADISRPLLAVWGDNDTVNPYADSAPLLRENPDAQVSIITNAAALPHAEQPAEFARVVRDFLDGG